MSEKVPERLSVEVLRTALSTPKRFSRLPPASHTKNDSTMKKKRKKRKVEERVEVVVLPKSTERPVADSVQQFLHQRESNINRAPIFKVYRSKKH